MVLETTFSHAVGHGRDHRCPGHGRRQPGTRARQRRAAPAAATCDVRRGRGRADPGVRPAARSTGWSLPCSTLSTVECPRRRAPTCWSSLHPTHSHHRPVGGLRPAPAPPRRECGLRPALRSRRSRDRLSQGLEPIGDRRTARRHRDGVGVVVGAPPGLRGSMEGPGASQRAGAPVALLRTHRRDLRGGDHLAAGGGGRRPKLGLPLRLGPGRFLHDPGALGGGLS